MVHPPPLVMVTGGASRGNPTHGEVECNDSSQQTTCGGNKCVSISVGETNMKA